MGTGQRVPDEVVENLGLVSDGGAGHTGAHVRTAAGLASGREVDIVLLDLVRVVRTGARDRSGPTVAGGTAQPSW